MRAIPIIALAASAAALLISVAAIERAQHADGKSRYQIVQRSGPATPTRVSRSAWPALGMNKTIMLGEAVQKIADKPTRVVVACASPDCRDLMNDIDDAMQIANWSSDLMQASSTVPVPPGIFVGPKGETAAAAVATALGEVLGIKVDVIEMGWPAGTVGVMIGDKPR